MEKEYILNGKKYSKEQLNKIGNNVASLWGGSCYEFEINEEKKEISFICIEHGEHFSTTLKYNELDQYK